MAEPAMTVALVCSTGGHLAEMVRLRPRFTGVDDVVWITHESDQSRALLEGEETIFVPYTGPRQARAAARNALHAARSLRERGVTGAARRPASRCRRRAPCAGGVCPPSSPGARPSPSRTCFRPGPGAPSRCPA